MAGPGLYDNQFQCRAAFPLGETYPKLIAPILSAVQGVGVDVMGAVKTYYIYSLGEYDSLRLIERKRKALVLTILNTIAYVIPDEKKCTTPGEAIILMGKSIKALMKTRGIQNFIPLTPDDYRDALAEGGDLRPYAQILPRTLKEWENPPVMQLTLPICAALLMWIAEFCTMSSQMIQSSTYVHCFVGLAKRGTITEDKLEKLATIFSEETSVRLELDSEIIRLVYSSCGRYINETNAQVVFERLIGFVDTLSLRAKITLNQTANSRLTSITTIRVAIAAFPNFRWDIVQRAIPNDWAAAINALNAINNNPYYGFKADLSAIASTKYKTLAYIAKELLIRYGGVAYAGLAGYQGFTRAPAFKDNFNKMIRDFNPTDINWEDLGDAPDLPAGDAMRAAVQANNALV